jgi:hypothetical protein
LIIIICIVHEIIFSFTEKYCKCKGDRLVLIVMKKLLLPILVLFLVLSTTKVLAGGFNLQSIGQLSTGGRQISHWWYAGSNEVMKGEAIAGSTVTVSIDGTQATVMAGSDGNWTYDPGTLISGDHAIILTNNDSTINFTLTTGAENLNMDAIGKDTGATTLPATGVGFPTVFLLISGSGLVLVAKKLAK